LSIHPWNQDRWTQLTADREHLPHALLLHGPKGVGKRQFALDLAQWLLCDAPGREAACSRCPACNWFVQGNHPDFRLLEPREEEEGGEKTRKGNRPITVDQVREVVDLLALTAHRGGWRVVVIVPAEAMHTAAANGLLKTLEEPPPRVLLVLVSHQPRRLPATILSRCRKLPFTPPAFDLASDWLTGQGLADAQAVLREAGGAPLLAQEYAGSERSERRRRFVEALARPTGQDWPELAASMQTHPAEAWGWLLRWVCDLLAARANAPLRYFPEHKAALLALGASSRQEQLWGLYGQLTAAARWLNHPLNAQLLLESWLLQYGALEATP
jgi:DNA polymerase III subunit delta'